MGKIKLTNITFIQVLLWCAAYFSGLALVYHTRWFIPYLSDGTAHVVPADQLPLVWFIIQICRNLIFLLAIAGLIRLFREYRKTGFFDSGSIRIFNLIIIYCLSLALLGAIQTVANNFHEVHFSDWVSFWSVVNLLFRSFTRLLVLQEPETMYLILALILWSVRQIVGRALIFKEENEAFV